MADTLAVGDLVADIDGGQAAKVVSNALEKTIETVYNFEVKGNHNYFADHLGLWVHNASLKGDLLGSTSLTPPVLPDGLQYKRPENRDKGRSRFPKYDPLKDTTCEIGIPDPLPRQIDDKPVPKTRVGKAFDIVRLLLEAFGGK